MLPINSESDVLNLEQRKQVIAVFVASGLDEEALSWVFNTWWELDARSGDMWHVVFPLKKLPSHKGDPPILTHANFNVDLARQFRETYGVEDKDTPVLVFDDFNEEAHQRQVSLMDKPGRKDVITKIEKFMKSKVAAEGRAVFTDVGRRAVIAELADYLARQKLKKTLFKAVPRAGSALAKIAITQGAKYLMRSHGIPIP